MKARTRLSSKSYDLDEALKSLGRKMRDPRWTGWTPGVVNITNRIAPTEFTVSIQLTGDVEL